MTVAREIHPKLFWRRDLLFPNHAGNSLNHSGRKFSRIGWGSVMRRSTKSEVTEHCEDWFAVLGSLVVAVIGVAVLLVQGMPF